MDKLIKKIEGLFWFDYCNKAERIIGIYNDNSSLKFANGNPDLKKLVKNHGFKVQYVIK